LKGDQIEKLKAAQDVNQLAYLQAMDSEIGMNHHQTMQPDYSKKIHTSAIRRKKLLNKFFEIVSFDFETVYNYIQENKRASFREVDYNFFLIILDLQSEFK
jgi:hypothetical protein